MAIVREFKGLRPKKEMVDMISELPYDVCSREEAFQSAKDNPYNFYHITRSEIDLSPDTDPYDAKVYEKAKSNLEDFIKKGFLAEDPASCFYFYTLVMNGREQTGLVACTSIDDYQKNIIKKHELTREDKEQDRIRHIDTLSAQTGLVFLFYKNSSEKRKIWEKALNEKPEYDFVAKDGIRHIFRVIKDSALIGDLKEAFKNDILYIADGHHRAASGTKVGLSRREKMNAGNDAEYNYFLSVVFPHDQLMIMPYNRLIKDLNGLSEESFMGELKKHFYVEETGRKTPSCRHEISLYIEKKWYSLKPSFDPGNDPIGSLDVSILQEKVLAPVLGIDDPRKSKRIDFSGGIRGTSELESRVDKGEFVAAFSMFPTSIEELIDVADSGNIMPPKSTWFEPKLRDGLIIHRI